jgi:hypothetical protein
MLDTQTGFGLLVVLRHNQGWVDPLSAGLSIEREFPLTCGSLDGMQTGTQGWVDDDDDDDDVS